LARSIDPNVGNPVLRSVGGVVAKIAV